MEDLCPTSHNMSQPVVTKLEMQVLSADYDSGEVSLLTETGDTKDDVNLPHVDDFGVTPEYMATYEKISKDICAEVEKGEKTVMATVQTACDMERIIALKLV